MGRCVRSVGGARGRAEGEVGEGVIGVLTAAGEGGEGREERGGEEGR